MSTWGNSSSSYNYNSNDRDVKMSIEFYKQKNLKRTTEISFRENIVFQDFLDRVEGKCIWKFFANVSLSRTHSKGAYRDKA